MTFYQELQLNQAGSKALIKNCSNSRERIRHIAIYIFKVLLTVSFCAAFVIGYSMIFGSDNSIVGVVVLLSILVFRNVDLGMHTPHSLFSLSCIFIILTFCPRAANLTGAFGALVINLISIWILMVLGCHNVLYYNHSTLLLSYLLLFGYDVSGRDYILRIFGMAFGFLLTALVFWRNHRKKTFKRGFKDVFLEYDLRSSRSRWQLLMASGVSSVIFFAMLLHMPRAMWAGIAAMSVMLPFRSDLRQRVRGRIPGNIAGGILFAFIYTYIPSSLHGLIGIAGGIGVGFSATYGWQAIFNSLGAMSIAVGILGFPGAIFYRIFHNVYGALYALLFERIFHRTMERLLAEEPVA